MFEIIATSVFVMRGQGTVFAGQVVSGVVQVGDRLHCRTPSREIPSRIAGLETLGTRALITRATAGTEVGVLCRDISRGDLSDAFEVVGGAERFLGVTLVSPPLRWWEFWRT